MLTSIKPMLKMIELAVTLCDRATLLLEIMFCISILEPAFNASRFIERIIICLRWEEGLMTGECHYLLKVCIHNRLCTSLLSVIAPPLVGLSTAGI